jgi:hypothetical protein
MTTLRAALAGLVVVLLSACLGAPTVEPTPAERATTWFIEIEGEGGTWLGPDALRAMGLDLDAESPPSLRVSWDGREIPYLPRRSGETWGVFLFNPDRSTRTSRRTAIRIDVGEAGPLMAAEEPGVVEGGTAAPALVTRLWEEDERYLPQAEMEVPWLWQRLRTPSMEGVAETLELPDAAPGPITVVLDLWSHTEAEAEPDHRLVLSWDGEVVDEWTWDGRGMQRLSTSFAASGEEAHTLALEAPPLPGAEVALVWLDGWQVTYPRHVVADGAIWRAMGDVLEVTQAEPGARILDVTDPFAPRDLGSIESNQLVPVTAGRRYWVGVPEEARGPLTQRPARSLDVAALEDVEHLSVAPSEFHQPMEELLQHRRGQGLSVALVDPQAVYDAFGTGQPDPGAIQTLVRQLPDLRYLLLVGDATAEPGGYDGEAGALRVVTPFTRTAVLGETPADGLLGVGVQGQPRVTVGRFPATSSDDVAAMVAKTIQWEQREEPPDALLVSDDEAEFAEQAQTIEGLLPRQGSPNRIDAGEAGGRARLLEALGEGPSWLNYTGHGSLTVLCDEGLIGLEDAESWREPVLTVAWTCLAAHYAHPTQDSMGETWLRAHPGGAVAFLGPVGETTSRQQEPFLRAFYATLEGEERLGDAWLAALRQGPASDVRWGFVLLGDPALLLNLE